jgi:hypothetical protein
LRRLLPTAIAFIKLPQNNPANQQDGDDGCNDQRPAAAIFIFLAGIKCQKSVVLIVILKVVERISFGHAKKLQIKVNLL